MLPIHGQRIRLRDFQISDLASYRRWHLPGHRWQELDGPYYRNEDQSEAQAIAEVDAQVDRLRARIESGKPLPTPRGRLVIADRSSDLPLGTVSWYWIGQETWWAAAGIGIWDPANWGQGLGYEALGLWVEHLFLTQPRFVRLDLRTWSGNAGMMQLAEKLGFVCEARFRKARVVKGIHYDGLGYGVLREEWRARYPRGFAAHLRETRQ